MKGRLKGFVEGTTHVTTGDKMKPGDHRRDKRNCYYYNSKDEYCTHLSRKCTGSSHCDYYNDGIKVKIIETAVPNLHTHETLLMKFLQDLKKEINYKSLEGRYLCRMILKKYHLTKRYLDEAEAQIKSFEHNKTLLVKEIYEYNEKLKRRCILIGLLIVTAPFCYAYYQNNSRKKDKELSKLREDIVDDCLQQVIEEYNTELSQYQESSKMSERKKASDDKGEHFFARAINSYTDKDFERFCEMILKSIKNSTNISAILYLADLFKNGNFFEKSESNYLLLLLYASYLGNKGSSYILGKSILEKNRDSKLGKKFLEKANKA